jgi:hypothetical protein
MEPLSACHVDKRFAIDRNRETRCHGIDILVNDISRDLQPSARRGLRSLAD